MKQTPSRHHAVPEVAERREDFCLDRCWNDDQAARLHNFVKSQRVGYGLLVAYDEPQLPAIELHVDDTIERLERRDRRGQTGTTIAVATRQGIDGDARAFYGHWTPQLLGQRIVADAAHVTDQHFRVG